MTQTITKRTFEAAKHPKGSDARAQLNLYAETSEYLTSHKWVLQGVADNGAVSVRSYRTRAEAEAAATRASISTFVEGVLKTGNDR